VIGVDCFRIAPILGSARPGKSYTDQYQS